MNFIKTDITNTINSLRQKLYHKLANPIDAMWEQLYIKSSQHYIIEENNITIGYCCINDKKVLLQLFLLEEYNAKMNQVFKLLIETNLIYSASLSANEPISFNTSLDYSKSIKTNTFCFQHLNTPREIQTDFNIELVTIKDIPTIKIFLKEQVGMDDTFGYTENLVARKELFMVKKSGTLIATSECRMSDSQPEVADLGIIVNKNHQGKGIATKIMKMQVNRVLKARRKPICSTSLANIASRKAIEKSGFYCSNIIFDISFTKS